MDIENIICNEKSLVRNEKYRELVADDFAKKYYVILVSRLIQYILFILILMK